MSNKLEYSADKLSAIAHKQKHSSKKKHKKHDRSMDVNNRSREYFDINKKDRKNTLSGHKRT